MRSLQTMQQDNANFKIGSTGYISRESVQQPAGTTRQNRCDLKVHNIYCRCAFVLNTRGTFRVQLARVLFPIPGSPRAIPGRLAIRDKPSISLFLFVLWPAGQGAPPVSQKMGGGTSTSSASRHTWPCAESVWSVPGRPIKLESYRSPTSRTRFRSVPARCRDLH